MKEKVVKVGVWRKGGAVTLEETLKNGWDLVLAESDAGRPVFGPGHMLHFRDAHEKYPVSKALEQLGFHPRGYDAYLVTGTPEEYLLKQLQGVFPGAVFFDIGTEEVIMTPSKDCMVLKLFPKDGRCDESAIEARVKAVMPGSELFFGEKEITLLCRKKDVEAPRAIEIARGIDGIDYAYRGF